jgi:hypothetical protein
MTVVGFVCFGDERIDGNKMAAIQRVSPAVTLSTCISKCSVRISAVTSGILIEVFMVFLSSSMIMPE